MSRRERTRGFVKDNALSLVFGILFLGSLVGQALAGWSQFSDTQHAAGLGTITLGRYLTSADFAVDVVENWQSEYLQFLVYIMLTIWLVQKGSTESKQPGEEGPETDDQQKLGWHTVPDSPSLVPHPAELAVGVPRRRVDGDLHRLPAPTRLDAEQTGR